jgi:3,2-trans-enoyl-CoA isomerase
MLEESHEAGILTLRLARPPVNALNGALLDRLQSAIEAAPGRGMRGVLLTGARGRFSAGLDVPELLALDRAGIGAFWRSFLDCLASMARSPIPLVAAINGHSPAGGAVLALFCDRRVMVRGDYRIGLNEVQVGLYPGPTIYRVLERVVGPRHAAALLPVGALLSPEEAVAVGFVDELASPEEVEPRSRAWLASVLALPPLAYARTRALARADLIELMGALTERDFEVMTDSWFRDETQATLRALVARLKRAP